MMSLVSCGHFPVLFVACGVEDKVEAVLQPEEEGDDEADVGDVVVVVAADELEGDDGQVADEVAHADGADGLGHALVARRQLVPHVVAVVWHSERMRKLWNYPRSFQTSGKGDMFNSQLF